MIFFPGKYSRFGPRVVDKKAFLIGQVPIKQEGHMALNRLPEFCSKLMYRYLRVFHFLTFSLIAYIYTSQKF